MSNDLTGKAVVLGLDGATWDLLVPLAERGVMPHLARALERGRHGRLQSCLPPYSSPAWMSISTGRTPAAMASSTSGKQVRPASAGCVVALGPRTQAVGAGRRGRAGSPT